MYTRGRAIEARPLSLVAVALCEVLYVVYCSLVRCFCLLAC